MNIFIKFINGNYFVLDKKIVFEYIMYGLKKIKSNTSGQSEEEIVKFLEKVEEFKHCEDETAAGGYIDSLGLTLSHVPGHMLKSEIVIIFKLIFYVS